MNQIIHSTCGLPVELCACKTASVTHDSESDRFIESNGCACVDVEFQSYDAEVAVDAPPHMLDYRDNKVAAGLSPKIMIDACALPEIRELWGHRIRTYGSCCGHNKGPSMVNVHEDDAQKMDSMGYKLWPYIEGRCKSTYYLNSVGRRPTPSDTEATKEAK